MASAFTEEQLGHQLESFRAQVSARRLEAAALEQSACAVEASLHEEGLRADLLRRRTEEKDTADSALLQHLAELEERRSTLQVHLAVADAELAAAEGIMSHLEEEQRRAESSFESMVSALKERYVTAQNSIAAGCGEGYGAASVVARSNALQEVLAEQENELSWLRDVIRAAQLAAKEGGSGVTGAGARGGDLFNCVLSAPTRVVLPTASCTIPVPSGRMRRLTGASGGGLQDLRRRFLVSCKSVEDGASGMLQIEIQGHINGVRQCADEIVALLQ